MRLAPIVLFVYNRPEHTLKTLEALAANELSDESHLIIYADGPKSGASFEDLNRIKLTRKILRERKWAASVEIIEAESNRGLAQSVIRGVTEVVDKYGKIIVLEDDLITSKGFLPYMNKALNFYEKEEMVMQVSGYAFPIKSKNDVNSSYFLPMTSSWGWATWKRAWDQFDAKATGYEQLKTDKKLSYRFNIQGAYPYTDMLIQQMESSRIDSWAIRWFWSVFKKNGLVLFPTKSLIYNNGFGRDATHTTGNNANVNKDFDVESKVLHFPEKIICDKLVLSAVKRFITEKLSEKEIFNFGKSFFTRIKNKLRQI